MRSIPLSVAAAALAAIVLGSCGDGGVAPEDCTGTCIEVSNLSTLTVDEVKFSACGDDWGSNRLGSGEIAPGDRRAWAVTAGCWDITAVAPSNGQFCGKTEYGVDIAAGTTHVLEYEGCP
jgi:hypothetical protein